MVALSAATVKADDHSTKRTLAKHLSRYVNVKGFGALGNGVNDDTNAILAAAAFIDANDGTLYFPKGSYKITQSIAFSNNPNVVNIEGEPGTVITGNFNDYIFKYHSGGISGSQRGVISGLKLVNTHATGGGIKYATVVGGTIRDCVIVANRGINTSTDDDIWVGFEVSIDNCHLSPGENVSGSYGLLVVSDGPIRNCTMTGFETGAFCFAGQGCQDFQGCKFELCATGISPGRNLSGLGSLQAYSIGGCRFKDCGIAIDFARSGVSARVEGLHIEAAEGTISGDPQYGIKTASDSFRSGFMGGVNIVGTYAVAGAAVGGNSTNNNNNFYAGIGVSGGAAWASGPTHATNTNFIACNRPINVVTTLPADGNLREGDSWNVSNSNTATWGATYAAGGSNHVKVRYNGSAWTVVGA